MNKSIKTRLVINFMLIIIITVFIAELIFLKATKNYYYKNIEDILTNQIEFSISYYLRYFSSNDLEDIIIDDIDIFWKHTDAQVQIINKEGKLLMDSLGIMDIGSISPDIEKAIKGEKATWIGNVGYYDKTVMSVAMPIKDEDEIVGIIRFISSLEETRKAINKISVFSMGMGLIVILISGLVSIFLANSIVKPLQEVTKVAEKMAKGKLKTRSKIVINDEIGKLSSTLNYMAEELIKKEEVKNDFISSISHELRTPLTSIKGWAITLQSEELYNNEILIDGLNIIEKKSDRLANIVEELLDFSKFVSGRIKLERNSFSIKDTIEIISKQLRPRILDNKIEFKTSIDSNLDLIYGDENRLKQVLINILDNAIKFTPEEGKISLEANRYKHNLILKIEDNGCGIPESDLPNIKEKFYKGNSKNSNTGIGLSICNEIIKLHDGSIDILSKVNQGTTVIIEIPLGEVP